MVTLYHMNHGCRNCRPGIIFELCEIRIDIGAEYAEDYKGWQRAFPGGLSIFGYRHMTPDHKFGECPTPEKLEIERQCELVRKAHFKHKPSRYQSFFGFASQEEAVAFRNATRANTGITGSIWEVSADRIHHRGDMRLLTPETCNDANLRAYWNGTPLDGGDAIWECLTVPPVTMVRCVVPEQ